MIETADQRAKRMKKEVGVREERAAAYAEKMKTQLQPTNATPAAIIPTSPPVDMSGPMGPLAAKVITKRIRENFSECLSLIVEAHDRKAWAALGYDSWGAYAVGELDFSRQRGYQLLSFAKTAETLQGVSTMVDTPESERQTRPMDGLSDADKKAAWKSATKAANGQPTGKQVAAAVEKRKAKKEPAEATFTDIPATFVPGQEELPHPANIPATVTASEAMEQARQRMSEAVERAIPKTITDLLKDLDAAWSFDNGRQHTHDWHTKQDFMERWRPHCGGAM